MLSERTKKKVISTIDLIYNCTNKKRRIKLLEKFKIINKESINMTEEKYNEEILKIKV